MTEEMSREEYEVYAARYRQMNLLPGQNWPRKFEFNPQGSSEGLEAMNLDVLVPDKDKSDKPLEDIPYEYSGGIKVYDLNKI